MKYLLLFFSLTGTVVSFGCTPDGAATPTGAGAETPGVVRLNPTIRLKTSGPMSVPLSLSNGSDKPFNYIISSGEIVGMDYSLYRNGKIVPRDTPTPGPTPSANYNAKTIKPNESLPFSYKLKHSKLEAGEYDLQIVYRVHKGSTLDVKYNATPADFTLTYTLVVE